MRIRPVVFERAARWEGGYTVGACQRDGVAGNKEDEAMPQTSPFKAIIQNWQNYANGGNTGSILNLYKTDAVALFTEGTDPPGKPSAMIQGAAAIVADLGKHFGPNNPYQNINLVEVAWQQQGNSGWSYGTWTAQVQGQTQPGSWSVVWAQGSGNTPWVIQVHAV